MIEQEYILLIMNCNKYVKKAKFQKQTWLKTLTSTIKYYHVIGDEELTEKYKFDDDSQILWVKAPDDYNSLPKKVIAAFEAVHNVYNFKYLFKTDDDQILVKPSFFDVIINLINKMVPTPHYGGYMLDIKKPHFSHYYAIHPELPSNLLILPTKYCTGRFYFLSKFAIIDLISKKQKIGNEYFEDYAIGYHLSPLFKTNLFNISTNKYFTDIELSDFPRLIAENKI